MFVFHYPVTMRTLSSSSKWMLQLPLLWASYRSRSSETIATGRFRLNHSLLKAVKPGQLSRCSNGLKDARPRSILGRDMITLFSIASTPSLGPTRLPTKWVPGAIPPELGRRCVKLSTCFRLVLSQKYWSYTSTPHLSFWCSSSGVQEISWWYSKRRFITWVNSVDSKILTPYFLRNHSNIILL